MKTAARDQASQDIDTKVSPGSAADRQLGEATKYYTTIGAKDAAYGIAKKSVDTGLSDEAEHWMTANWNRAQIVSDVKEEAKRAAWDVLKTGPASEKVVKRARSMAHDAAKAATKRTAETVHRQAEGWKNAFVKPKTVADRATAPGEVARLETQMKQQAQTDDVGGRALQKTIQANTTDEGLSIVGKLLDGVVPMAGDQVSLSIELKIPIPDSPAYVLLRLEGKAARGVRSCTRRAGVQRRRRRRGRDRARRQRRRTCLLFADDVGAEVDELPVVDCAVEHSHEIFAVLEHPDEVYPGFGELEDFAQTECLGSFEPYVGVGAFDSELFYSWLVPSLDGWNDAEDREILCVLGRQDAALMTGSMHESNI